MVGVKDIKLKSMHKGVSFNDIRLKKIWEEGDLKRMTSKGTNNTNLY